MLKGNKGEWSEVYVLLRLLADGKIFAADSDLNKLEDIFFPIIKIIRAEVVGEVKEYFPGSNISIYFNGEKIKEVPAEILNNEANELLAVINNRESTGAFSIEKTERFMDEIFCYRLSAPASDKSDITMELLDINTGYRPRVGFSIKSELGSSPTLLNAGKTTNFIYKVKHNYPNMVNEANAIYRVSGGRNHTDVRGRISRITEEQGTLEYYDMNNRTFKDNLMLIDTSMDKIIATMLLYFYKDGISDCESMVNRLEQENPLNYGNINAYRYKFKKFLTAVALGMKPATVWDGLDETTGGYIVVTRDGNVLAYHIYNRNYFEEYLLKNTKYETASTSRHEFGEVYTDNGEDFIKLNLQVRFK